LPSARRIRPCCSLMCDRSSANNLQPPVSTSTQITSCSARNRSCQPPPRPPPPRRPPPPLRRAAARPRSAAPATLRESRPMVQIACNGLLSRIEQVGIVAALRRPADFPFPPSLRGCPSHKRLLMLRSMLVPLLLCSVVTAPLHAGEKTVKVFILAGQSNMEGKAPNALLEHQAKDPKTKDLFAHLRKDEELDTARCGVSEVCNRGRMTTPSAIPEDRSLTTAEVQLIHWLLQHGVGKAADYRPQLERARVISRCYCGCASIDFAIDDAIPPPGTAMEILADYEWQASKGEMFGVFVFARNSLLAGLEVWSQDGLAVASALPELSQLRPFVTQDRDTTKNQE
jgi:hypothetical protein